MDSSTVTYEQCDAVVWLKLNRPEAMNALNPDVAAALAAALARAESDPGVRALVVTGVGEAFCAGADLKFVGGADGASFDTEFPRFLDELGAVFNAIEASPLAVVAAVNGLALAGGLELVLCCDLVIAADSARLGDAHANYGLLPGGGSSVRLPRKIGPTRAKHLLFTGDFVPARALVDCGLVNEVVADDALESTVQALAMRIATKSPLTIARLKQLTADAADQPLHAALRQEKNTLVVHAQSADMREGLAAFNEKRKPVFSGH